MRRAVIALAAALASVPAIASAQPCANPDPPAHLAAAVAGQRVILTWTAPTVPNDCPVTGYSVGIGYEPGSSDASETETPHTIAELIMGRGTYYARVQAIAGTQRSNYSADVTLTIDDPEPACLSRPQAPQTPTMTSDGGRVDLSWVPASGCPALGYLVLIGSSPGAQDRLSLIAYAPAVTVLLATGTAHAVVAGFNQEGIGAFSEPLTITTTARTPNPDPEPPPLCAPTRIPPPRNLRASVSALVATITWDAPIGGCVIGSYQVTGGLTPGASATTVFLPAAARSYQFPVGESQRLFVRVIADTNAGPSPPSNEVQIDGDRLAGCVGLTTASLANGVLTLQWAPTEHGCLLAGYQVQAGRAAGSTAITVDLPASARSFQASTRDAPSGVWFVRVATRIPGHGVTTPSNELRIVIP